MVTVIQETIYYRLPKLHSASKVENMTCIFFFENNQHSYTVAYHTVSKLTTIGHRKISILINIQHNILLYQNNNIQVSTYYT